MMEKHRWHKEICAWANGEQVQFRNQEAIIDGQLQWSEWEDVGDTKTIPAFFSDDDFEYRIKPKLVEAYCQAFIKNSRIGGANCYETHTSVIEFQQKEYHNIRLTFEDGTNKLLKAEAIDGTEN